MSTTLIHCTIPAAYAQQAFKIKNTIECIVATTTQYNAHKYFCKIMTATYSPTEFGFLSSHLANKIAHVVQKHFPFVEIRLHRQDDWR
jgi:hypothetical protein